MFIAYLFTSERRCRTAAVSDTQSRMPIVLLVAVLAAGVLAVFDGVESVSVALASSIIELLTRPCVGVVEVFRNDSFTGSRILWEGTEGC